MSKDTKSPKAMEPDELRDALDKAGFGQTEFARLIGRGASSIRNQLQGLRPVSGELAALLRLLAAHPELKEEIIALSGLDQNDLKPPRKRRAREEADSGDREAVALAERRAAREEKAATDAKLLRFHEAVIDGMRDPQQVDDIRRQALAKVDLWEREGAASGDFISRWRLLLDMPLDDMASEVLSEERWGPALRQATPFGFMYREHAA